MNYKKSILSFFMRTYGIGKTLAQKMCYHIDVSPTKLTRKISERKRGHALKFLRKLGCLTGFLLKNIQINSLLYSSQIKNTRSFKFKAFLPINGQRNRTNGRTAKKRARVFYNIIRQKLTNKK
jgi:ribosomal protein S13